MVHGQIAPVPVWQPLVHPAHVLDVHGPLQAPLFFAQVLHSPPSGFASLLQLHSGCSLLHCVYGAPPLLALSGPAPCPAGKMQLFHECQYIGAHVVVDSQKSPGCGQGTQFSGHRVDNFRHLILDTLQ
jgi:hypothetical protein